MIIFMAYYVSKYWKEMHKFLRIFKLWLFIAFQAGLILAISSNLSSCLILLLMVFVLTIPAYRSRSVWYCRCDYIDHMVEGNDAA